jgi:hypothetical protein
VEEGALFGAASVSAVTRRSVSDLGSESIAQPRSTQGKAFECDAWASLSQRGHRVDGFKSCVWTMRTIGALCTRSEIYLPGPDAVGMLPYFTTGSRFLKGTSINSLSWRGRAKMISPRRAKARNSRPTFGAIMQWGLTQRTTGATGSSRNEMMKGS